MPEYNDQLPILFQRYLDNSCSREELDELVRLVADSGDETLYALSDAYYEGLKPSAAAERVDWESMLVKILSEKAPFGEVRTPDGAVKNPDGVVQILDRGARTLWHKPWLWAAVAACLVLFISLWRYAWPGYRQDLSSGAAGIAAVTADTVSNKAILTLAGGQRIVLNDSSSSRLLAEHRTGGVDKGNQLIYDAANPYSATNPAGAVDAALEQTLSVPRGARYSVVLSDGTLIMLNAGSSLTYPARFSGLDRSVRLTGEGYFKTATDAQHPFVVTVGASRVRVLGTVFNINAYHGLLKTTLESGRVAVATTSDSLLLKPGEQAGYMDGGRISHDLVNVDNYTAWTRDGIVFDEHTTLADAMEMLGRTYDYDIRFADPELKELTIAANIEKSPSLLTILGYIHKITDIEFDTDQSKRKVIVHKGRR